MSGWKDWAVGEVVEEADFQSFIQNQVVQVYASSAARSSALGTAVSEGMISYLKDIDTLQAYNTVSGWVEVGGGAAIESIVAGTALSGGGSAGTVTINANLAAIGSGITITSSQISDLVTSYVSQTNGVVTTAATGSAVVRNVSFATAAPGTANGMDGDVWLVYTP